MEESSQKLQTSIYNKISKSRNVMYRMETRANNTVLYFWKLLRVDPKSSYHWKKIITNYGDGVN